MPDVCTIAQRHVRWLERYRDLVLTSDAGELDEWVTMELWRMVDREWRRLGVKGMG